MAFLHFPVVGKSTKYLVSTWVDDDMQECSSTDPNAQPYDGREALVNDYFDHGCAYFQNIEHAIQSEIFARFKSTNHTKVLANHLYFQYHNINNEAEEMIQMYQIMRQIFRLDQLLVEDKKYIRDILSRSDFNPFDNVGRYHFERCQQYEFKYDNINYTLVYGRDFDDNIRGVIVRTHDIRRVNAGEYFQNAFDYLEICEREFLISGIYESNENLFDFEKAKKMLGFNSMSMKAFKNFFTDEFKGPDIYCKQFLNNYTDKLYDLSYDEEYHLICPESLKNNDIQNIFEQNEDDEECEFPF